MPVAHAPHLEALPQALATKMPPDISKYSWGARGGGLPLLEGQWARRKWDLEWTRQGRVPGFKVDMMKAESVTL